MLTKRGQGKYFSKEWQRKRAEALVDRTRFTQAELDWLEITGSEGLGRQNPDNFTINRQSMDRDFNGQAVPARPARMQLTDLPGHGEL